MNKVLDDFFKEYLKQSPDLGSFLQLNEYNNKYSNFSYYIHNYDDLLKKYKKKISKYNDIHSKTFKFFINKELDLNKYNLYITLNPYSNPILYYIELCKGDNYQKLKTKEDFLDFINKTNEFCNYLNGCLDELMELDKNNIRLPKFVCKILINQIDNVIDNKLYLPNVSIPYCIKKYYINFMNTFFKNKLVEINSFIKKEYYPKCNDKIGLYNYKNGIIYYSKLIKYTSSFNITPQYIHNLGLSEVNRIQKELLIFKNKYFPELNKLSLLEFFNYMRNNKKYKFNNKKELLSYVHKKQKIVEQNYKKYFNERIKHKVIIKQKSDYLEKNDAVASLEIPSYNFKKPSYYYINTYLYNKINKYDILPLTLHESIPGHHFQLTYHLEQKIPHFMIYCYNNTTYIEGWALYSETLFPYENKYEMYSKLNFELGRAIRLVLDTGINCFKWSYNKCLEYYKNNSSLSIKEIENELLRFICIPTQALNYKLGEIFFNKYVSKFNNIKEAHTNILKNGPVPLCFLDNKIFNCKKNKKTKKKLNKKLNKKISKKK